jgi:hypothetical protein
MSADLLLPCVVIAIGGMILGRSIAIASPWAAVIGGDSRGSNIPVVPFGRVRKGVLGRRVHGGDHALAPCWPNWDRGRRRDAIRPLCASVSPRSGPVRRQLASPLYRCVVLVNTDVSAGL